MNGEEKDQLNLNLLRAYESLLIKENFFKNVTTKNPDFFNYFDEILKDLNYIVENIKLDESNSNNLQKFKMIYLDENQPIENRLKTLKYTIQIIKNNSDKINTRYAKNLNWLSKLAEKIGF